MSLELIANEDVTLKFSLIAGPADLSYSGDIGLSDPAISTTLAADCKAESKKICTKELKAVFTPTNVCPFTSGTHTFSVGAVIVLPSAVKTKANGFFVMRETDSDAPPSGTGCIGAWVPPSTPPPTVPCACGVEVISAGQTKVKAQ